MCVLVVGQVLHTFRRLVLELPVNMKVRWEE